MIILYLILLMALINYPYIKRVFYEHKN